MDLEKELKIPYLGKYYSNLGITSACDKWFRMLARSKDVVVVLVNLLVIAYGV